MGFSSKIRIEYSVSVIILFKKHKLNWLLYSLFLFFWKPLRHKSTGTTPTGLFIDAAVIFDRLLFVRPIPYTGIKGRIAFFIDNTKLKAAFSGCLNTFPR